MINSTLSPPRDVTAFAHVLLCLAQRRCSLTICQIFLSVQRRKRPQRVSGPYLVCWEAFRRRNGDSEIRNQIHATRARASNPGIRFSIWRLAGWGPELDHGGSACLHLQGSWEAFLGLMPMPTACLLPGLLRYTEVLYGIPELPTPPTPAPIQSCT